MPQTTNILLSLSWYESRIHAGLLRHAKEYNWLIHTGSELAEGGPFDGAVFSYRRRVRQKWIESLPEHRVLLFDNHLNLPLPNIDTDHEAIGRMAAQFFADRGFKNFACLFPHPTAPVRAHQRLTSFAEEARRVGGNVFTRLRPRKPQPGDENRAKIDWYKDQLKDFSFPIGVFLMSDSHASLLQFACSEMGISIPEEVAIISVNNDPMICLYTPVSLTSVDPGWEQIGYLAGTLLHRMMKGEQISTETHLVSPIGIVERRSSLAVGVEDHRVSRAITYIWENYRNDPSVEQVCDAVHVPRSTLERLFRQKLGRGIKEEIQSTRIRDVKRLLLETNLSATAIAAALNYSDVNWMFKVFKKHTGMTTKQFRKQNRG